MDPSNLLNGESKRLEELKTLWSSVGQGHVFRFWDKLNDNEKKAFLQQLQEINISEVAQEIATALKPKPVIDAVLKPVQTFRASCEEMKEKWTDLAYDLYSKGNVALLLMAGGQGTRLGTAYPKGTYDLQLLSGKTLFQIQAERIIRLQNLIHERKGVRVHVPWYIMLSFAVENDSLTFFKEHNYFGLREDQVIFFKQGEFPCVDDQGKIILDEPGRISTSPNGNGGIWRAMKEQGILDNMKSRGIKIIASYIVDNILCKVGDPLFVGFTAEQQLEVAVKVCPKAYPEERVGVVAMRNNVYTVLEYSEINEINRNARDANGDLVFSASHSVICNYDLDFVINFCNTQLDTLSYHLARKAIPYIDENGNKIRPTKVNGTKFELFSFDIFESAKRLSAFEINRSEEFSPLKNSPDSQVDSPNTCRLDLSNLHKTWITKAGGKLEGDGFCEISPLISYFGEGLKDYVDGKTFTLPYHLSGSS